jgi:hypothetical protein
MEKYIVIAGIFEGLIFEGEQKNGRTYNKETAGQSYPCENCLKIDPLVEILLSEGKKRLKGFNLVAKTILNFCDFEYLKYYFKIDFTEAKTEKEVIKQMLDYLNNEGFEKYEKL